MNLALFGGTFDPIHRGHITVARAAVDALQLKQVWFVPADIPPHKQKSPITSFHHRYAMVALALAGEKDMIPSLAEAPDPDAGAKRQPSYSLETVRRVKKSLGKSDRLYFLIGMDAFQDIAKWYKAEELLAECEFIVAARPGFSLADVASSLPQKLRPSPSVTKLFPQGKDFGAAGAARRDAAHAAGDARESFGHADSGRRRKRRSAEATGSRCCGRLHPEGKTVPEKVVASGQWPVRRRAKS